MSSRWSRWWRRPIMDGQVECTLHGVVDEEQCAACPWLLALDPDGSAVRCRPDAARLADTGVGI